MKLGCMLVGKPKAPFIVNVIVDTTRGSVEDLKNAIIGNQKYNLPTSKLKLYLAKRDGAWLNIADAEVVTHEKLSTNFTKMDPSLQIDDDAYYGKNFAPNKGDIHVLVELPAQHESAGDAVILEHLMPVIDEGWTSKWLKEFRLAQIPSHSLPLVEELEEFIEGELPVKIGVHRLILNKWNCQLMPANPKLMSKIFKINNAEPCIDFYGMVIYRVADSVKPGRTEYSFHSFWDNLIHHVLDFVLPGIGASERYWDCPNYVFILDSVCVLRGNEEAPEACMRAARRELYEKLIWTHGSVPYLFGYAAAGFDVRLYAITHADIIELGRFNLEDLGGRFRLLLAILNIARLFQGIANLCPESGRDEYRVISRQNGIQILLQPTRVIKCFPEGEFEKSRHILDQLYAMLRHNRVPNVDRLVSMNLSTKRMIFKPRGIDMKPSSLEDLFRALRDILSALVKLHALSWMHRDIRWPNVLKRRDGSESWFLIDFMDAAHSPQKSPSGQHLSREEHAPEIFNAESHTIAVDMWSLGYLIETSGDKVNEDWYDLGGERTKFMERLLHSDPSQRPSAAEALEIVGQLEEQYLTRKKRKIEV